MMTRNWKRTWSSEQIYYDKEDKGKITEEGEKESKEEETEGNEKVRWTKPKLY